MAILRFVLIPIIVILFINNFVEENYIYMFIGLTLVHWIIGILYYFYSSNKIRNIQSSYTTPWRFGTNKTSSYSSEIILLFCFIYFTSICLLFLTIGQTIIPSFSIWEKISLFIFFDAAVNIILSKGICSIQPLLPSSYFETILVNFNFSKILLEPSCKFLILSIVYTRPVSYTHLRAHET